MMEDFDPYQLSSFTEHEIASVAKSLKLNSDQCQCLLNCLNRLLKQVNDFIDPKIIGSYCLMFIIIFLGNK